MVSERSIRLVHLPLFVLVLLSGIVALAISGSLVGHYNSVGYPNVSYRDRIRILLVASIWTVAIALYLLIGVTVAASHVAFGIMAHLVGLAIGFILYLIGVAALTALTRNTTCGDVDWSRCNIVKGLVAISWIETIWLFIGLIFVFALGVKARSGAGMTRGALTSA
ncbi:hypothetical protein OIO90_000154 [Microbotryomycetes sp. JL221]|nr:hypothetical protein OIO90_000154 [Microbotryomycetes sp. JL221]